MSSSQQLLLGEGAGGPVSVFIEDVYSTYLYTGNGSTQTITNGIDLSTKGGLVWAKSRSNVIRNSLFDTARGANFQLSSNNTESSADVAPNGITFNSTGFTTGSFVNTNTNAATYVSWTFRKQPKFFDIVTYTGNGTSQTISHNLGSTPGCIFVKSTSANSNWIVYHIGLSAPNGIHLKLNSSDGQDGNNDMVNGTSSTTFSVGSNTAVNASAGTYVAYLFAHNAGGFGALGTDNVISCGSFSVDGAASFSVNLGYEPQWVMIKSVDNTSVSAIRHNWIIYDSMRNLQAQTTGSSARLFPNLENIESSSNEIGPTATGFESISNQNPSTGPYIYIAIRRGPMKVPTSATTVFAPITYAGDSASRVVTGVGFSSDLVLNLYRQNNAGWSNAVYTADRLRGLGVNKELLTTSTGAEGASGISPSLGYISAFTEDGFNITAGTTSAAFVNLVGTNYVNYLIKRAPSVFDIVCYIGDGTVGRNISHNLGVLPELVICKSRSAATAWKVNDATGQVLVLNSSDGFSGTTLTGGYVAGANATNVQVQGYLGSVSAVNASAATYVLYLFATCAGVSKVGGYTGNGTAQTIDCGFGAGGARFVLIKRTDATGSWYAYDTARGMTVLTDPYLLFNSNASEVATLGSVTTVATGFALNSAILADINISAGTYIFLAFA